MPKPIKKLPKYNGFLVMEYIPVVFSESAICRCTTNQCYLNAIMVQEKDYKKIIREL